MPRSLQLGQDPVQELKLTGRPKNLLWAGRLVKQVIREEQIRVVANLPQLHRGVLQHANLTVGVCHGALHNLPVIRLLPRGHGALDRLLLLLG